MHGTDRPSSPLPATALAVATYVIIAGIVTQSGVILAPAAAYFHTALPDTAVLFSYIYAGNLGGISASLFVFTVLTLRQVICGAYTMFFAGVALVAVAHALPVAFAGAVLVGFGGGTGLSAGAVILSKTYAGRRRAIAFLGTDCAFSATGYVVPSLVGLMLAAGWRWQSGYLLVAAIPALAIAATFVIRLPPVTRREIRGEAPPIRANRRAPYLRIALFGAALAVYLTGQTVFTVWAPAVLQNVLGVTALRAGSVVGTFFGASSFGLVTAAVLVNWIPPRSVLLVSLALGTLCTLLLARTADAAAFFILATAFGFTSTCMFKLMISIGSEQLHSAPPQLVTFLLLCSGLGGIVAPALSAPIVKAYGVHASLYLCFAMYATTFVLVAVALAAERGARGRASVARTAPAPP